MLQVALLSLVVPLDLEDEANHPLKGGLDLVAVHQRLELHLDVGRGIVRR